MKIKKYILVFLVLFLVSCDKNQENVKRFYGAWTISKFETYLKNSNGNYDLINTYTDAGFFLLYDRVSNTSNLCSFKIDTNDVSGLMAAVSATGSSGGCYWYPLTNDQIDLWHPNTTHIVVGASKKGYNKMEWTFKKDNNKEIYYLSRADV